MEQIKYILHKLEELNNQSEKSVIDFDLMLDYTKKMYEFILDQKKQPLDVFTATSVITPSWNNTKPVSNNNQLDAIVHHQNEPIEQNLIKEEAPTLNTEANTNLTPILEAEETPALDPVISKDHAIVFELPSTAINMELPTAASMQVTAQEEAPVHIDNTIVEEELVTFPVEFSSQPLTGQGFIAPIHQKQKDIRKSIGVNDQYLFLNELFQNDKGSYDLAISTINNLNSYVDARNWIEDHVSFPLGWDKEDNTVATFYQLIENHFNSK